MNHSMIINTWAKILGVILNVPSINMNLETNYILAIGVLVKNHVLEIYDLN